MKKTLLIVDDNKDVLSAVKMLMRAKVDEVITESNPSSIPVLLQKHKPQVVLLDMNFRATINTGNEGLFWLREIKRMSPETSVVLFTAYADVALAVEGMKIGASDFIVKPFDNTNLSETLLNAFGSKKKNTQRNSSSPQMLWGESPEMQRVRKLVEKVAPTDANILITGENGTGKDLLAREIHRLSNRSSGPIEIVDMGAVIETLFESELYGHAKGAFTDAKADRAGKFETAHGGTLFLDEIGNIPYHLQAKLLTSLQQRKIIRVGTNTPRDIDIRLICATNRNLQQMVAEGDFRQDLFYRINTVTIELPPLRNRPEDIPALVEMFVKKYAGIYSKPEAKVTEDAMKRICSQSWPGNIRQLEHTVEKALILSDRVTLGIQDFDLHESPNPATDQSTTLESMERNAITSAIKIHGGNMSEVARHLGITRQTLYNKLRKYGL
ncbi:MAG: sigma-54 dependent transcriptional regulator [Muribaculaceae bacterium]|nr:sigma-54 dependent transcriptional regulator [Muribaculaceae bacterium]